MSACRRSTCTLSMSASFFSTARKVARSPAAPSNFEMIYSASVGSLTPSVASSSARGA